jgi:glycosyltransferase 2 family protein
MISAFLRMGVRPRPARWLISSMRDGSDRAMPRGRLLQAVGVGLTLLGVVFTGRVMLENAALSQLSWDARLWASVAVACAAYALLSVLLVLVWATILKTFAPGCIGAREAFALYATTQIMKYVPSNIVHYVGRHVALRRRGVAHLALVSTVFAEAAVLACGACLAIAALEADVLMAVYRRYVGTAGSAIVITVGLACCVGATLLWRRAASARGSVAAVGASRFLARLMAALTAATLFFAATTLLVSIACRLLLDDPAGFDIAAVAATLAGAWVVGFVIPGASAGIGVREAAVILLLSPALGAGNAAVVATIYRLVTAGGDTLFAALGELVRRSARLSS